MPRSDSGDSSGASLTSEEEEELPRAGIAEAPAATLLSSETASATVAGGNTRSNASQKFRQAVTRVSCSRTSLHSLADHGGSPGFSHKRSFK
jgi:hypothetical protein